MGGGGLRWGWRLQRSVINILQLVDTIPKPIFVLKDVFVGSKPVNGFEDSNNTFFCDEKAFLLHKLC